MTGSTYPDDPDRWVERRTEFLSARESHGVGLREKVAEAVAWSELGYTSSGIVRRMDVAETTAGTYLDAASSAYPGILARTVLDIDGDTLAGVENLPPGPSVRECPVCLNDTLVGVEEMDKVFRSSGWGATSMLDDADVVCSVCHAVKIDGQWERMQSVDSRAWDLSEASSSKSTSEYREILTRGIDTGKRKPSASDEEGWNVG